MKTKTQKLNPLLAAALMLTTFGAAQIVEPRTAQALDGCGRLNQKACKAIHPGPRCVKGLKVKKKVCVAKKAKAQNIDKIMRKRARAILKQTSAQRKLLKNIRKCVAKSSRRKAFKKALNAKNPNAAYNAVSKCLSSRQVGTLRAVPRGAGRTKAKTFNTMTIGIGAGGVGGFGVSGSAGIVINFNRAGSAVRFYTSGAAAKGIGLALGADVQVGLSTSRMPSGPKTELGSSIVFAGKFLLGGSASIDFNRYGGKIINPVNIEFEGFGIAGGAGVGVELGTRHNTKTKIW